MITRRDFVKAAAAGLLVAGCGDPPLDPAQGADVSAGADVDVGGDGALGDVGGPDGAVDTGNDGVDAAIEAGPEDAATPDADAPDADAPDADVSTPDADVDAAPVTLFDPGDFSADDAVFPLGVQSGCALPEAAIVWTCHKDADTVLTVHIWESTDQAAPYPVVAELDQTSADGGFTHLDVDGLSPGVVYRFCWTDTQGRRSTIGRFRTAIAPDAIEPLVFGGCSCTSQNYRPFEPLRRAAEAELDFFVLGGDTTYNDGATNVAEYRAAWAENIGDISYRELLASTSIMASWDDHEVDNNWDPETIDAGILGAATQTFYENLALRRLPDTPDRIWRSFTWGQTLEMFVLDCRGERVASQDIYISPEQMQWLKEGLSASQAVFKFIVNSVPITDMPPLYISQNDRWEGYPAQRAEIIDHCAAIDNVYWLSGDFHFPQVSKLDPDGPGALMTEVLMGPGGNFPNPAYLLMLGNSQFDYVSAEINYTRFSVDPFNETVLVEFIDGGGTVVYSQEI